MIFQHTHELVTSGRKTQTRRIVKAGETNDKTLAYDAYEWPDLRGKVRLPQRINAIFTGGETGNLRCKWQVGKTYAVCPGRGKKAVARIRITGIRQEPVEAISEADAKAEGFANKFDFWETWKQMHGHTGMQCWVLEFELVS